MKSNTCVRKSASCIVGLFRVGTPNSLGKLTPAHRSNIELLRAVCIPNELRYSVKLTPFNIIP